jgi:hypothetical protein
MTAAQFNRAPITCVGRAACFAVALGAGNTPLGDGVEQHFLGGVCAAQHAQKAERAASFIRYTFNTEH